MFKNILLATDGSAASEHAAKLAVSMARLHGATLTALLGTASAQTVLKVSKEAGL